MFGGSGSLFGGGFGAPQSSSSAASSSLFGLSGGFGQPAAASASSFGFGQPAAPAGGGLFGAQPASTGFGGFGTPAAASPFGAQQPTTPTGTSTFGFGQQPAASSFGGGGFGGSAFGAPVGGAVGVAVGGAFGSTPSASAFGAAPAFGTPAPSGGAFGSTPSTFGAAQPAAGFGATPGAFGGGFGGAGNSSAFSASPFGGGALGGGQGTTGARYQTTYDADSKCRLISISAMEAYKHKSFEELRFEDYRQGKGPVAAVVSGGMGGIGGMGGGVGAGVGAFGGGGFTGGGFPSAQQGTSPFPAQTAASPFGAAQPAASPSPFGGAASTSPFGGPAGGGLFGQSATSPFGATPAAAPVGGGLFGSTPASSSSGGFGGLFGGAASSSSASPFSNGFGQPTSSSAGGLFGGGFGSQQASSGSSLFGNPASSGGGMFAQASTGGLFGSAPASSSSPFGSGGGLFGGPAAGSVGGGLFGGPAAGSGLFGGTAASSGAGGLFGGGAATGSGGGLFGTTSMTSMTQANHHPTPTATLPAPPKPAGLILPKPADRSLAAFLWKGDPASLGRMSRKEENRFSSSPPSPTYSHWGRRTGGNTPSHRGGGTPRAGTPALSPAVSPRASPPPALPAITKLPFAEVPPDWGEFSLPPQPSLPIAVGKPAPSRMIPRLVNPAMFTRPSIEALSLMTEGELARVEHFVIGHFGRGSVTWPGVVDVRFLDIDSTVSFEERSVAVYPIDEEKPAIGMGLNKPAVVELRVVPKNLEKAKSVEHEYVQKMRAVTAGMGAEFISYDLEYWRFKVPHFSRWGIDDDEWMSLEKDTSFEEPKGLQTGEWASIIKQNAKVFPALPHVPHDVISRDESMVEVYSPTIADRFEALNLRNYTYSDLHASGFSTRHADTFLAHSFRAGWRGGELFYPDSKGNIRREQISRSTDDNTNILAIVEECEDSLVDRLIESCEHGSENWRVFKLVKHVLTKRSLKDWLSETASHWVNAHHPNSPLHWLCAGRSDVASEILVRKGAGRLALLVAAEVDKELLKSQGGEFEGENMEIYKILTGDLSEIAKFGDWHIIMLAHEIFGGNNISIKSQDADFKLYNSISKKMTFDCKFSSNAVLVWVVAHLLDKHTHLTTISCAEEIEFSENWEYAVFVLRAGLICSDELVEGLVTRKMPELSKDDLRNFQQYGDVWIAEKFPVLTRHVDMRFISFALALKNNLVEDNAP